jgi:hypothetical protein
MSENPDLGQPALLDGQVIEKLWVGHPPMSGRVGVRGLPLIHDKTVDEWGTKLLGYFMTGPPARDLLDHVIVLNERHLKRLMNEYIRYYHEDRTHLALAKETPAGREAEKEARAGGRVISMPRLGGLHHRYDRAA